MEGLLVACSGNVFKDGELPYIFWNFLIFSYCVTVVLIEWWDISVIFCLMKHDQNCRNVVSRNMRYTLAHSSYLLKKNRKTLAHSSYLKKQKNARSQLFTYITSGRPLAHSSYKKSGSPLAHSSYKKSGSPLAHSSLHIKRVETRSLTALYI